MTIDAGRAMLAVQSYIVESGPIRGPNRRARGVDDDIGEVASAGNVADSQGVEFRTGLVRGPCQQFMIRRVAAPSKLKKCSPFCERIAVEQNLRGAPIASLT